MKHFTTEEWIDFANQVVSPSALDEMENHLKQGCKRCQEAVSVWQRLQKSAAAELPAANGNVEDRKVRFCRRSGGSINPTTGQVLNPGNFGRIISTSNNPRILQFALKFNF